MTIPSLCSHCGRLLNMPSLKPMCRCSEAPTPVVSAPASSQGLAVGQEEGQLARPRTTTRAALTFDDTPPPKRTPVR